MSTRAIQAKLRTVLKDFLSQSKLGQVIDDAPQSKLKKLGLFTNDEVLSSCGDDIFLFKREAESCINIISTIDGKLNANQELQLLLLRLINKYFEDIFSYDEQELKAQINSGSKRQRSQSSNTPSSSDIQDFGADAVMTSSELTSLKSIVNKLMKNPLADPFLYPVDKSIFPDYYELIQYPTDLSTIKKKLNAHSQGKESYTTASIIHEIRLLWENCKQYNAEGSAIYDTAEELSVLTENMIQEHFGDQYSLKKSSYKKAKVEKSGSGLNKGSNNSPRTSSASSHGSNTTSSTQSDHTLLPPLTTTTTTIKANTSSKSTTSSTTATAATTMSSQKHIPRREMMTIADYKSTLNELLKDFRKHTHSEPFLEPIPVDMIPGYSEIIDRPMDLTTLEQNIRRNQYSGVNIKQFFYDVELIFINCMTYNDPNSELYEWADIMYNYVQIRMKDFRETITQLYGPIESPTIKSITDVLEEKSKTSRPQKGSGTSMNINDSMTQSGKKRGRKPKSDNNMINTSISSNEDEMDDENDREDDHDSVDRKTNKLTSKVTLKTPTTERSKAMSMTGASHQKVNQLEDDSGDDEEEEGEDDYDDDDDDDDDDDGDSEDDTTSNPKNPATAITTTTTTSGYPYLDSTNVILPNKSFINTPSSVYPTIQKRGLQHYPVPLDSFSASYQSNLPTILPTTPAPFTTFPSTFYTTSTSGSVPYLHQKFKRQELGPNGQKCWKIVKYLYRHASSPPFQKPVDPNRFPGYMNKVKTPMDLALVRSRLNQYETNPQQCLSDLLLIFDNCMAYHKPTDVLYNHANTLKNYTLQLFADVNKWVIYDPTGKPIYTSNVMISNMVPPPTPQSQAMLQYPIPPTTILPASAKKPILPPTSTTLPTSTYSTPNIPSAASMLKPSGQPATDASAVRKVSSVVPNPAVLSSTVPIAQQVTMTPSSTATTATTSVSALILPALSSVAGLLPLGSLHTAANLPTTSGLTTITATATTSSRKKSYIDKLFGMSGAITAMTTTSPRINESSEILLYSYDHLKTLPEDQIISLIQIIEKDTTYSSDPVVLRAKHYSTLNYNALNIEYVPYKTPDNLFEVLNFGEILSDSQYYTTDYLYPKDYKCKTSCRIYLIPKDYYETSLSEKIKLLKSSSNSSNNSNDDEDDNELALILDNYTYVKLDITSTIISTPGPKKGNEKTLNPPKFELSIDGVGILNNDQPTPYLAWYTLLSNGKSVLPMLGSKLKRCRGVFNQLCCHPEIIPFLEQVPMTGVAGQDYYQQIKSPMWLREIHTRLVEGTYDNEYDFAWDIRLIFNNCMIYNHKDSDLYHIAEILLQLFDYLFCYWVTNIQDHTITDLANGPWNDWQYLKYYDCENPKQNICSVTSTPASEAELIFCTCCENQYLPHIVNMDKPLTGSVKDTWICPRCDDLKLLPNYDQYIKKIANISTPDTQLYSFEGNNAIYPENIKIIELLSHQYNHRIQAQYYREEYGGYFFSPCPELGPGWSQVRKKSRTTSRHIYISPLGYEVYSREDALKQKAFEEEVNVNLLKSRENEFQEYLLHKKSSGTTKGGSSSNKQKGRHKRRSTQQSPTKVLRPTTRHSTSTKAENKDDTSESISNIQMDIQTSNSNNPNTLNVTTNEDEDKCLVYGKLCDYLLPEDYVTVWCIDSLPEKLQKYTDDTDDSKGDVVITSNSIQMEDDSMDRVNDNNMIIEEEKGQLKEESMNVSNTIATTTAEDMKNALISINGKIVLNETTLPGSGMYGLDNTYIRTHLEGQEMVQHCDGYQYSCADTCKYELLQDLYTIRDRKAAYSTATSNYHKILLHERWYWEYERIFQKQSGILPAYRTTDSAYMSIHVPEDISSSSGTIIPTTVPRKEGCLELFPADMTPREGETLLCIWDFLEHLNYMNLGRELYIDTFSLAELKKCILSIKDTTLCEVNQAYYDDIACTLTDVLLNEIKHNMTHIKKAQGHFSVLGDDLEYQEFLWNRFIQYKPLNVTTWPQIALLAIQTHTLSYDVFSTSLTQDTVRSPPFFNVLNKSTTIHTRRAMLKEAMRTVFSEVHEQEAIYFMCNYPTIADSTYGDIISLLFAHPYITYITQQPIIHSGLTTDASVSIDPRLELQAIRKLYLNTQEYISNYCKTHRNSTDDTESNTNDDDDSFVEDYIKDVYTRIYTLFKHLYTQSHKNSILYHMSKTLYMWWQEVLHKWDVNVIDHLYEQDQDDISVTNASVDIQKVYKTPLYLQHVQNVLSVDNTPISTFTPHYTPELLCRSSLYGHYLNPFIGLKQAYPLYSPFPLSCVSKMSDDEMKGSGKTMTTPVGSIDNILINVQTENVMTDNNDSNVSVKGSGDTYDEESFQQYIHESNGGFLALYLQIFTTQVQVMHTLRFKDPESWSKPEKLDILSILVDQCARTSTLRTVIGTKQEVAYMLYHQKISHIHEVTPAFTSDVWPTLPKTKLSMVSKKELQRECYYMQVDSKYLGHLSSWIHVPDYLLAPPKCPPPTCTPNTTDRYVWNYTPQQALLLSNTTTTTAVITSVIKKEVSESTMAIEKSENSNSNVIKVPTNEDNEDEDDNKDQDDINNDIASSSGLSASSRSRRERKPLIPLYTTMRRPYGSRTSAKKSTRTPISAEQDIKGTIDSTAMHIASARDSALRDKIKYMEKIQAMYLQFYTSDVIPIITPQIIGETIKAHASVSPTTTLGYDRYGREYWILSIQEYSTCSPIIANVAPNGTTTSASTSAVYPDPCILIREPDQSWSYYTGKNLPQFLNSFDMNITCERILRENLIERLHFVRRKLYYGHIRLRPNQVEWIGRYSRCDMYLNMSVLPSTLPSKQHVWYRETLWYKCYEIRTFLYYSMLYRDPEEPGERSIRAEKEALSRRLKKYKETLYDDYFDLHSIRGWVRDGPIYKLKQLYASTMASRLLSESYIYKIFQAKMRLNKIRSFMYNQPMNKLPLLLCNTSSNDSADTDQDDTKVEDENDCDDDSSSTSSSGEETGSGSGSDDDDNEGEDDDDDKISTSSGSDNDEDVDDDDDDDIHSIDELNESVSVKVETIHTETIIKPDEPVTVIKSTETNTMSVQDSTTIESTNAVAMDVSQEHETPQLDIQVIDTSDRSNEVKESVNTTIEIQSDKSEIIETKLISDISEPLETSDTTMAIEESLQESITGVVTNTHVEIGSESMMVDTEVQSASIPIANNMIDSSTITVSTAAMVPNVTNTEIISTSNEIEMATQEMTSEIISTATTTTVATLAVEDDIIKKEIENSAAAVVVLETTNEHMMIMSEDMTISQDTEPHSNTHQSIILPTTVEANNNTINSPPNHPITYITPTPSSPPLVEQLSSNNIPIISPTYTCTSSENMYMSRPSIYPIYSQTKVKLKYVEMLHRETGELLRIHPSQKEAADYLGTSQAAISQACSGLRADAYGFRWRFYDGPPLDLEAMEPQFMPLEEIKKLQILRGKPVLGPHSSMNMMNNPYNHLQADLSYITTLDPSYNIGHTDNTTSLSNDNDQVIPSVHHTTTDVSTTSAINTATISSQPISKQDISSVIISTTTTFNNLVTTPVTTNIAAVNVLSSNTTATTTNSNNNNMVPTSNTTTATGTTTTMGIPVSGRTTRSTITNLVLSDIPETPRLLKLKSEFMSIYYTIPPIILNWPPLSEIKKDAIYNSIVSSINGNTSNKGSNDITTKYTDVQIRNIYDKYIHKKIKLIHTPGDLLHLILLFESAIPDHIWCSFYSYPTSTNISTSNTMGNTGTSIDRTYHRYKSSLLYTYEHSIIHFHKMTCAYVALHLFSLDRSLRYEEISNIEIELSSTIHRTHCTRTQYTPKCFISCNCIRPFYHEGKCTVTSDNNSRISDISDTAIQTTSSPMLYNNAHYSSIITNALNSTVNTQKAVQLPTSNKGGVNIYSHLSTLANNTTTALNQKYQLSTTMSAGSTKPVHTPYNVRNTTTGRFVPGGGVGGVSTSVPYNYDLSKKDPSEFDIEYVQPYVPTTAEILSSTWI